MNVDGSDPVPAPTPSSEWFLGHIDQDAQRLAAAVRTGRLDAPIEACPGWDLRHLTAHIGVVQRWAAYCAAHAAPPESRDEFQPDPDASADALAVWFLEGAAALIEVLRGIDPEAPTWHPFPVDKIGRVWPRRQAHELSVHRWDAEHAVGATSPIDPELASDGIDEHLTLMMPRLVARDDLPTPRGSLHLHCTDTHGEWLVTVADGEYRMVRAHQKGDAALRGPAEALLLTLWQRPTHLAGELSPVGDETVLARWIST